MYQPSSENSVRLSTTVDDLRSSPSILEICVEKLEVQFNMLSGLARRPIAHTCSNILELPATYQSYPEFMKEFQQVLSDETYS